MKKLKLKTLIIILLFLCLGTVFLLFGALWDKTFLIPGFLFFISGLIIMFQKCRCPYCGQLHTIERLLRAAREKLYCRRCGRRIEIDCGK